MTVPRSILTLVVLLTTAVSAAAQCVSSHGYGTGSANTIGFVNGGGWSGMPEPPIAEALALWATACGDEAGLNVPALVEGTAADIVIGVVFAAGERNPQLGGGCAYFDHLLGANNEVIGGTIMIYPTDSYGSSCELYVTTQSWLDGLIAHEIGHVLGLADSSCNGYIMGPNPYADDPTSAECASADDCWVTDGEAQTESCSLACPVACTGNPPVCDTSGNGGEPPPCGEGGPCSPLILDLDGDGIRTTSASDGVYFDISADGHPDLTGWTVRGEDDALLFYDLDRNGRIDGGHELFGEMTLLEGGTAASNGFAALAARDSDGDGVISPSDAVWGSMRLWVDMNHDGTNDPAETFTLGQKGVTAISLGYITVSYDECVDTAGNFHRHQGTFSRRLNGGVHAVRPIVDVYFRAVVAAAD